MTATWFLVALACLQAGAAISMGMSGKLPMAGVYTCYAISNVLFIWIVRA